MNWPVVALGDVADIERVTVDPASMDPATAYVGLEHIERGGRSLIRWSVGQADVTSNKYCFDQSHVLFGKLRPNLGKIVRPSFSGVCSTDILPVRVGKDLDADFLAHYLRQPDVVSWAASQVTGANLPRLSPSALLRRSLPLPPLREQRRIAAILDQAALLTTLREKATQLSISLGPSLFAANFGQPLSAGGAWPQVSLGDLARIIRGASPRPAGDPRFFGGHIPWLKISDVTATKGREVRDIASGVTDAGRERSVLLPPETLILTNSATVGIAKIIGPATCVHDGFLAFLDLDDRVDQVWLWAALQASRDRLVALAPEGTQKNLNGPIVKAVKISLPPIEMQRQFATKLRKIESRVALYESALSEAQALATSLHDKAFSGQL